MQPHIVYLANSSGPKVGITRATQLPTRWIDQGAIAALPLFKVTSRYDSGRIEAALRTNMSDRTNWQRMLKNQVETVDLAEFWREIANEHDWTPDILRTISGAMSLESIDDAEQLAFTYPVIEYPQKVKALNLDKTPSISGRLCGIKGQYLILDTGVINIRKFSGYEVEISAA
ncbi:MAG: hypothetical protein DHS20C01_17860 [marine bacterium B5-7]|nr:MAG: hypothetical protein DHS20C01_17860 [marine bacterium B5-7]